MLPGPPRSRSQRFLASRYWWALRNVLGWLLILASFVAGPLVPGPGGIPLFLIGFALVSFPGKRRLTARVLRGRPVLFRSRPFALVSLWLALVLPAVALVVIRMQGRGRAELAARGPLAVLLLYLLGGAIVWCAVRVSPHALNVLLRLIARSRRTFRPWLRRHRIRLLPPRWRRRRAHESGRGPFRLTDEILKFHRRKRHR
jgi:hypothetical protein